jgi:hypothetical protein
MMAFTAMLSELYGAFRRKVGADEPTKAAAEAVVIEENNKSRVLTRLRLSWNTLAATSCCRSRGEKLTGCRGTSRSLNIVLAFYLERGTLRSESSGAVIKPAAIGRVIAEGQHRRTNPP